MASNFILTFNREMTVDGKVYPAGAIVPAGVLRPALLASLRDSNRIIEIREDELVGRDLPRPHRVPQLDQKMLYAARELVAQRRKDLAAAEGHLAWLEAMDAEDHAPIEETEPETRGTTTDFEGVAKVDEPAAETVEDAADGDDTDVEAGDGDDAGDVTAEGDAPRGRRKAKATELPPQLG